MLLNVIVVAVAEIGRQASHDQQTSHCQLKEQEVIREPLPITIGVLVRNYE
jgi:hypothetical protein